MNPPILIKRFVVYRRLAELLLICFLFSALITLLNMSALVVKRYHVVVMILAFVALFAFFNFRNLRKCYFDLRDRKLFFGLNFLSHAIFAAVNVTFFVFASDEIYTWLFAITKCLAFAKVNIIYSILFFHIIGLICIITAPIGMGWIFIQENEEVW